MGKTEQRLEKSGKLEREPGPIWRGERGLRAPWKTLPWGGGRPGASEVDALWTFLDHEEWEVGEGRDIYGGKGGSKV